MQVSKIRKNNAEKCSRLGPWIMDHIALIAYSKPAAELTPQGASTSQLNPVSPPLQRHSLQSSHLNVQYFCQLFQSPMGRTSLHNFIYIWFSYHLAAAQLNLYLFFADAAKFNVKLSCLLNPSLC